MYLCMCSVYKTHGIETKTNPRKTQDDLLQWSQNRNFPGAGGINLDFTSRRIIQSVQMIPRPGGVCSLVSRPDSYFNLLSSSFKLKKEYPQHPTMIFITTTAYEQRFRTDTDYGQASDKGTRNGILNVAYINALIQSNYFFPKYV